MGKNFIAYISYRYFLSLFESLTFVYLHGFCWLHCLHVKQLTSTVSRNPLCFSEPVHICSGSEMSNQRFTSFLVISVFFAAAKAADNYGKMILNYSKYVFEFVSYQSNSRLSENFHTSYVDRQESTRPKFNSATAECVSYCRPSYENFWMFHAWSMPESNAQNSDRTNARSRLQWHRLQFCGDCKRPSVRRTWLENARRYSISTRTYRSCYDYCIPWHLRRAAAAWSGLCII